MRRGVRLKAQGARGGIQRIAFTVDTVHPFAYSNGPKVDHFQQHAHVSCVRGFNPATAGQMIGFFLALGFVHSETFFQSAFDWKEGHHG